MQFVEHRHETSFKNNICYTHWAASIGWHTFFFIYFLWLFAISTEENQQDSTEREREKESGETKLVLSLTS